MPAEAVIHPFPGLRPFEQDEHDLFFGREGQSEEILAGLRQHHFVAVVGASGSGKSSLVRAGLLPYLHGGFLADAGSHWRIAIIRPGGDPIKNLATALDQPEVIGHEAPNADAAAQSAVLLEVSLRRSGLGLIEAVRLARLPPDEQVLIVVDQFEELFRFAGATDRPSADEDAAAFVKLLLEASRQRQLPIYVVLTMRSDYIGDCARYRDLPEAVTSGLYLIPRMTRDQRRAAIVEPVRVGGGTIAPRLITRLLNDVGDDPDQLPILQHALMRSWDYWQAHGGGERSLDTADYVAIGGMAEALSQHAEEAYAELPDDRHREIAKRIFQALSDKGPDNREARRPTAVGKLAQVADAPEDAVVRVIEEFRSPGRSFLMPAAGVALKTDLVIDISHESLIRGWNRMRQWVEEEADSARVYRRLADTALLYAQGAAGLLRDPDLQNVLAWRDRARPNAAWGDRYQPDFGAAIMFLDQSRLTRDIELRQKQSARRRLQLAGFAATAVIAIVAVVALLQWREAKKESDVAQGALNITSQIASSLVFELGSDPRFPQDMRDKTFDRAIQGYDEVIAIKPTSDAYYGRSLAYRNKGDLDRAIADANEAIRLNPKNADAYIARANSYDDKGDHDRAIADYDQAIALDPKNTYGYYNRALAYRRKNDFDRAIADYTETIALDPKYVDAYYGRGIAYENKHDYDRAIADYTDTIKLDPKRTDAYIGRGNAYDDKGDHDHAIADYTQAIAIDPKNSSAYYNRALTYRRKNDFDHAITDYTQAITLDPKYVDAYYGRAIAYRSKGEFDRAITDYTQTITLDPKYTDAYSGRAFTYRLKGEFDRAITDYTQTITLDPKNSDAYYGRGLTYRSMGELDRAIADYTEAIALDPKYTDAYSGRAFTYRLKGEFDRAIADYTQTIALDSKSSDAYSGRGDAYKAKNQYDRSIADYTEAITLDPKYDWAFLNRGLANLYSGSLAKAMPDVERASEVNPKFAYTALWLEIVDKRSKRPSRLAQAVAQIDMTKWPAPILRLYLGQITADQVLAAARNPDPNTQANQVCEANFYNGELALQRRDTAVAARLFRLADTGCPKDYAEWPAARAELTALGQKPE
jgi:tetratricopeptide (TPR) repeat protein